MSAQANSPDPIDIAVGLRIRTLRKQRKLSQEQLARSMNITFQQVQKYERGTNRISASMMVRAARALCVKVAEFLPDEGDASEAAAHLGQLMTSLRGAEDLLQAYAAIRSARTRRAILVLARAMAETEAEAHGP
jgi:transcriptional regulator with XRE-family HTH domain